jgi:hypothetical protein
LKQLQAIEEREDREKRSSLPPKTCVTASRLTRCVDANNVDNDNNVDNRRKSSSGKNVRRLTLSSATPLSTASDAATDNDADGDVFVDNAAPEAEVTSALLQIRREKESLVSAILATIGELRDLQLVAMSYRVRQRAVSSKCPSYVTRCRIF